MAGISVTIYDNKKRIVTNRPIERVNITHEFLESYTEKLKQDQIVIAKDALKEEQSKGQFPKTKDKYLTIVDNKPNKKEAEVLPFGQIEYRRSSDIREVVLKTWDIIEKKSPVDTGVYSRNHAVTFNKNEIARSRSQLEAWLEKGVTLGPKDILRFTNITPYSGRLEREGISAGRRKVKIVDAKDKQQRSGPEVRKPNGAYVLAARAVKTLYGKQYNIKFEMLPANYIGIASSRVNPASQYNGSPWRKTYHPLSDFNSGFYVHPTVVIRGAST